MSEIINQSIIHLCIVLSSVAIAMLIAIPLAIIVVKTNFHQQKIVSIISLMQAVPTLAVFALLVPFIGIGLKLAITTFIIYAILPIFLGTIDGFNQINPMYYEIATALNLTNKQLLKDIEIPNAMSSIINGIRITTLYTISLASMATLVGAGGLGDNIYLGMQQLSLKLTLSGVIPLLMMTLIFNYLFNRLEHVFMSADKKYFKENNG